jgi:hypothetical protein
LRPNKIKKDIINPNKAMASVNAKPKIAYINNCCPIDGFLDRPKIKAPKTVPIPTPVPARDIVANPAPIYFALCIDIIVSTKKLLLGQ